MNKRLWTRGLSASLAAVPLTIGLSSLSVAGAGTSFLPPGLKGPAPASVKIGIYSGFSFTDLETWLAIGLGYFDQVAKRFHTAISWDAFTVGGSGEAAFLSGTDQLSLIGPNYYTPAVLGGKDQVGLFASDISLGTAMTALTKYKATYGSKVSDFAGTWCQLAPTGTAHATVLLEAALHHLDINKLNLTTIGGPSASLPTLQSGACQITTADSGTAVVGAVNGTAYIVQNASSPSVTLSLLGEQRSQALTVSHAFAAQYPKFTQALVDADLKGLLYLQANIKNPQRLYSHLPTDMQSALSLGAFTQTLSYYAQGYTPTFDSGEWTLHGINDSLWALESLGNIPVGSAVNPNKLFTNKYVFQAYKDLRVKPPTGPTAGVVKVPTSLGKPTAEAATAFALLTGAGLPANTGISPLSKIKA
jgi:ABC-type nitrate/sulfonate/bicarbonate transport system substrate-binding protein